MSNTITAYFKGRVGVAESVYQNDHGLIMAFDGIYLPAHFDCYFSTPGSEEAIAAIGADNRVAIPEAVLALSGAMTVHIPMHTGENDSEVEYIAYFKVIARSRPVDDGTPTQMTAIEQAIALLQNPIGNIESIVSEALSFTGETFDDMQAELDTWKGGVESDFDALEAQFTTAISAVTTDTEVTNIRVGADGVTYDTAGNAVRSQLTDLKADINNNTCDITSLEYVDGEYVNGATGAFVVYATWSRTGYIEAPIGKLIVNNVNNRSTYNAFYDANHNLVGAFTLEVGNNSITVPNNAIYYAISNKTADFKATKVSNPIFYKNDRKVVAVESNTTAISNINKNVFALMNEEVENGFLNTSGTVTANALYRTTNYIPVHNGDSFDYNIGHATTLPIICFYTDADPSTYVSAKTVNGTNGYTAGTFTANADGYVRFTYYYTLTASAVVFTEYIPTNVKEYVDDRIPPNNGVENLKILCLGDSIFGNDGEIVEDLISISGANVINGAVGGTRVTDRGGSDAYQYFDGVNLVQALVSGVWTDQENAVAGSLSAWADRLATLESVDMSTVDLITMDWGTNDYTGEKTIEEILTAYSYIIDSIQEAYPSIRILVITPIWRYFGEKGDNENSDNYIYNVSTLKEIATAIDNHAKEMRIESLQMYQKMPLSYNTADLYFDSSSTVHLNAVGNMVYAHILNGKIQSMY